MERPLRPVHAEGIVARIGEFVQLPDPFSHFPNERYFAMPLYILYISSKCSPVNAS